jgi:N-carbamoyl-L-amino-acid hydrolase
MQVASGSVIRRIGASVDQDRQWQRLMELAQIGATRKGGVRRLALSAEEIEARRLLIEWARDLGLSVFTDEISNLFFRLEGGEPDAAPVLTGSHIDTQPSGGKFDGAYGVVAGLEAVQAIVAAGYVPMRPIEVVAWLNEEGSRFSPGMMGSEAFTGRRPMEEILAVKDADGVSTEQAVAELQAEFTHIAQRPLGSNVASYVEAHIEQGPILEAESIPVGVVTGIQGSRRFRVRITGDEAHAGTEPMQDRKDALFAANDIIQAIRREFSGNYNLLKFTIGLFEVSPNAPSVVPSSAFFSIDLRHSDWTILKLLGDKITDICQACRGSCDVAVKEIATSVPLVFPKAMTDTIAKVASDLSIKCKPILSMAGHDACQLHYHCPSAMIFVPCHKGISHNEAESCEAADLAQGTRVLAASLVRLADE